MNQLANIYSHHFIAKVDNSVTFDRIMDEVATVFNQKSVDIKSHSRKREYVDARHAFCWAVWNFSAFSTTKTGVYLGGRDHTSILSGRNRVEELLSYDKDTQSKIERLTYRIKMKYTIKSRYNVQQ